MPGPLSSQLESAKIPDGGTVFAAPHLLFELTDRAPENLPLISSTKSMIGHALGAAGAIESVACTLMLHQGFVHPSINCADVHPEIEPYAASIPHEVRETPDLDVIQNRPCA